ncbi:hypothetical protein CCUS01_07506 [Colletotrichum cuscutae]|uniref:Uncharacterized protein n=1 Tax=Colletotrichum cuscutae TaxID=1209917 RepID=A0AAI9UYI8_9PEZI|nr:hypothetical protein CCUS01_07506 [Colletotrichum cuscutae]
MPRNYRYLELLASRWFTSNQDLPRLAGTTHDAHMTYDVDVTATARETRTDHRLGLAGTSRQMPFRYNTPHLLRACDAREMQTMRGIKAPRDDGLGPRAVAPLRYTAEKPFP